MPEQNNSVNQIFARISHEVQIDTWSPTLILRNGEIGVLRVVSTTDGGPALGDYIKVGDGTSTWENLPYPNNYDYLIGLSDSFQALTDKVADLETRVANLEGMNDYE